MSALCPPCLQPKQSSCEDRCDTALGSGGGCRSTGRIAPRCFTPARSHSRICQRSPCPFGARDVGQRFRAVTLAALPESSLRATDGTEHAMAAAHIHAPSPRDRREYFPNPHWHEQMLPGFAQQISGKEKAALARRRQPSLPPCLPACPGAAGSVLAPTGRRQWHSPKATGKPEIPADLRVAACRGFVWYTAAR